MRRYITDKPQSICGQELKALMKRLSVMEAQPFINAFYALKIKHRAFLEERNPQRDYKHQAMRSAFRSLEQNMPHLFTWKELPKLHIPPTINHLEGAFAHLKEKIKIHRGLSQKRKKKAAKFILASPPLF